MGPITVARTIQLILAPVVMVTASGIIVGALLPRYDAISNRLRAMARERFDLLRGFGPDFPTAMREADLITRERLHQIDYQVPNLLRRHKLMRNAVQTIYVAILIFIASMFVIALASLHDSSLTATIALGFFLAGTGLFLTGLAISAREMFVSHDVVQFEAIRMLQAGLIDAESDSARAAGVLSQSSESRPAGKR